MGLFNMFSNAPEVDLSDDEDSDFESSAEGSPPTGVQNGEHQSPVFDPIAVLEKAGIGEEMRSRVTRAQELLSSLPAETPDELKRNIVEASLKAFDVSINAIIDAADAQNEAFEQFISSVQDELKQEVEAGSAHIEKLEKEIADVKQRMALAEADGQSLEAAARAQIGEVEPVATFFAKGQPSPKKKKKKGKPANDVKQQVATANEPPPEPGAPRKNRAPSIRPSIIIDDEELAEDSREVELPPGSSGTG